MKESIWKDVPNYEGLYQISNDGFVKALEKRWITGRGVGRQHVQPEKIIKGEISKFGYHRVSLSKNGRYKKFHVHTIVALVFCPGWFKGAQPNHIDGNKLNNTPSNLEWITASENMKHAFRTGLHTTNQKHRLILSKTHTGNNNCNAVKVIDTATGRMFGTIKEAADTIKINPSSLYNYLKGRNKNKTTLKYA